MARRVYASPATIDQILAVARMVDRKNPPAYCGLENCARERVGLNLCRAHYLQLWKWKKAEGITGRTPYAFQDLRALAQPFKGNTRLTPKEMFCRVDGCQRDYQARGFCGTHYLAWYRLERRAAA